MTGLSGGLKYSWLDMQKTTSEGASPHLVLTHVVARLRRRKHGAPVQGDRMVQNPRLQPRDGHRRSLDNLDSRLGWPGRGSFSFLGFGARKRQHWEGASPHLVQPSWGTGGGPEILGFNLETGMCTSVVARRGWVRFFLSFSASRRYKQIFRKLLLFL